jgi:hypothetical protein
VIYMNELFEEFAACFTGERRTFVQDGDRVTMTAWYEGPGYRVGFGEVTGRILPAREPG